LENFLRHKPTERIERIQEIGSELDNKQLSSDVMRNDVNTVVNRWSDLGRQAKERQNELETTMSEAQQCERQLLSIQRWVQSVDIELQNRFDNEVLAEDLPEQVEVRFLQSLILSIKFWSFVSEIGKRIYFQ
jgi:hypothetical protein